MVGTSDNLRRKLLPGRDVDDTLKPLPLITPAGPSHLRRAYPRPSRPFWLRTCKEMISRLTDTVPACNYVLPVHGYAGGGGLWLVSGVICESCDALEPIMVLEVQLSHSRITMRRSIISPVSPLHPSTPSNRPATFFKQSPGLSKREYHLGIA